MVVPTNPLLGQQEIEQHLEDSGVRILVAWSTTREDGRAGGTRGRCRRPAARGRWHSATLVGDAPALDRVEPVAAGDTAVILHTSGTTGEPKAVELTHANLLRNCEVVVNDLLQLTSEDVVFGGLPLFHALGQTVGLNAAVRAGACLALLTRFSGAAALRTLQDQRVTVMQGVPAMYAAMLHEPHRSDHDLSRLRVGVSSGAPLPVEVLLGLRGGVRTVSSSRATGSRSRRRWRPSTGGTVGGSGRSGCPSRGSSSAWSTTRGPTSRTASRGRSSCAATT